MPEPCVGPFWAFDDDPQIVGVKTPLSEAVPYGDCLTCDAGHYEVWERWKKLGPGWLRANGLPPAIHWDEYDQYPRGRVIFNSKLNSFVIFADRRIQTSAWISAIKGFFNLQGERVAIQPDEHYRT